jgi:hypothetical protein
MLPQTDTSDAAAAAGECCHEALLPLAMLLCVLALVPVDSRLRCAEVCRGWRIAVADRRLWLRLDLSHTSGVGYAMSDALLCAAAARAAGGRQALDLTGCNKRRCNKKQLVGFAAVMAAVTANARTLRELRLCDFRGEEDETTLNAEDISVLLAVATQLQVLDVEARVRLGDDARRMLRGEPPFGPLRLRNIYASFMDEYDDANFLALLADVESHTWTTGLQIYDAWLDNPVALDAVVDLALARRFTAVSLLRCWLSPASVPALARLLGSSALKELVLCSDNDVPQRRPVEDANSAAQLAAALRANSTLQRLQLDQINLWGEPGAATILLRALMSHPSVRELSLAGNEVDDKSRAVAGAMVCALLANTPLRLLKLDYCNFRDEGLGPVVDALVHNTHLTHLDIGDNNRSTAFMRDRLLPAVRANRSLRELNAWELMDEEDGQQTADALLAARSKADDAAARAAGAVDGLSLQARV